MAADTGQLTRSDGSVRVDGLSRRFGSRAVLDDLGLSIAPGEFVALLGHSGSGKSTLLRALAGIDYDASGGGTVEAPAAVSMVFQDSRLLPWLRVLDNVVLGLRTGPSAAVRGREALAEVGLAGRERAWPSQLSGGEQQRAALARSLVREPALLLADEPFGALDALTRMKMQRLLRDLYGRHRPTVLLVTHDVDEAVLLADRVIVLDGGRAGLDLPVALPQPRSPRDTEFQSCAGRLLAALGVTEIPSQI